MAFFLPCCIACKYVVVVQSLSHVWLSATPWTAAHQASLSITNSRSSLKLMSVESVMPSSHLILCRPLPLLPPIFATSGFFPMSQLFTSGGQSIGASASASVLPINIRDWFPLGWTGLISWMSKGLSRVFSNTTVPKLSGIPEANKHGHIWWIWWDNRGNCLKSC